MANPALTASSPDMQSKLKRLYERAAKIHDGMPVGTSGGSIVGGNVAGGSFAGGRMKYGIKDIEDVLHLLKSLQSSTGGSLAGGTNGEAEVKVEPAPVGPGRPRKKRSERQLAAAGRNKWIAHVKAVARDKGISYAAALGDPETKSSYKKG